MIELFEEYNIFDILVTDTDYLSVLTNSSIKDIIDTNIKNKNPNFYLEDVLEYDLVV